MTIRERCAAPLSVHSYSRFSRWAKNLYAHGSVYPNVEGEIPPLLLLGGGLLFREDALADLHSECGAGMTGPFADHFDGDTFLGHGCQALAAISSILAMNR